MARLFPDLIGTAEVAFLKCESCNLRSLLCLVSAAVKIGMWFWPIHHPWYCWSLETSFLNVLFFILKQAQDPAKDHAQACWTSSVVDWAACIIADPHPHTFRTIRPLRASSLSSALAHITSSNGIAFSFVQNELQGFWQHNDPNVPWNIIRDWQEKWRKRAVEGEGSKQKWGQV